MNNSIGPQSNLHGNRAVICNHDVGVCAGLAVRASRPHRTGVTRLPPALVVNTTVHYY